MANTALCLCAIYYFYIVFQKISFTDKEHLKVLFKKKKILHYYTHLQDLVIRSSYNFYYYI